MVVDGCFGDFIFFDSFKYSWKFVDFWGIRYFQVKVGIKSVSDGVGVILVIYEQIFLVLLVMENFLDQLFMIIIVYIVDEVVCSYNSLWLGFVYSDFEGFQVDFMKSMFVNGFIDSCVLGFLFVCDEVFDCS